MERQEGTQLESLILYVLVTVAADADLLLLLCFTVTDNMPLFLLGFLKGIMKKFN